MLWMSKVKIVSMVLLLCYVNTFGTVLCWTAPSPAHVGMHAIAILWCFQPGLRRCPLIVVATCLKVARLLRFRWRSRALTLDNIHCSVQKDF